MKRKKLGKKGIKSIHKAPVIAKHAKKPNMPHDAKRAVRRDFGKVGNKITSESLPNTGSRLNRPNIGIWAEIRKLRIYMEWVLCNGISLKGTIGQLQINLTVPALYLPPTTKDIKEAEAEEKEVSNYDPEDEERTGAQHGLEILKKRARGEMIEDDDPGKDWDIF